MIMSNLWYQVKNSNIIVSVFVNPISWKLIPIFRKMPTYADDWLYDPDLIEFQFKWLFFKVSFFVETGSIVEDDWDSWIGL